MSAQTAGTVVLPVFRASAISRFAAVSPRLIDFNSRYIFAAANAAEAARVAAGSPAAAAPNNAPAAVAFATARVADTVARVGAIVVAAQAAKAAARGAARALDFAFAGERITSAAARAVTYDAHGLQERRWTPEELNQMELWPAEIGGTPSRIGGAWLGMSAELRALRNNWEVWTAWYDDVLAGPLAGTEHSEQWEMAFTDVGEPLPWDKGAAAVNGEIAARLRRLPKLGHKEASTEHGESAHVNKRATADKPTTTSRKSPPQTQIGRAVLKNKAQIVFSIEPLLVLIDQKIAALREERPNSDEAHAKRDEAIAQYEDLKSRLEGLRAAASNYNGGKAEEKSVVSQVKSFADGVSAWWTKHHTHICEKAYDAALFSGCVGVCWLAGSGGALAVAVSAALVGGKPIVDALKALPKRFGKSD
jgi:hypothetical protein